MLQIKVHTIQQHVSYNHLTIVLRNIQHSSVISDTSQHRGTCRKLLLKALNKFAFGRHKQFNAGNKSLNAEPTARTSSQEVANKARTISAMPGSE